MLCYTSYVKCTFKRSHCDNSTWISINVSLYSRTHVDTSHRGTTNTELTAFVRYIALAAGPSRGRSYTNSPVHSCFPPAIISLSPIRLRCRLPSNLLLPRHVGYLVITSYSVISYSLLVRVAGRIVSFAYVTAANSLQHAFSVRAFIVGVFDESFHSLHG